MSKSKSEDALLNALEKQIDDYPISDNPTFDVAYTIGWRKCAAAIVEAMREKSFNFKGANWIVLEQLIEFVEGMKDD